MEKTVRWIKTGDISGFSRMIDQTIIPYEFKTVDIKTSDEVYTAIKTMIVRGAPAIGIAGAHGVTLGAIENKDLPLDEFRIKTVKKAQYINSSRPTAVNLIWAINKQLEIVNNKDQIAEWEKLFVISEIKTDLTKLGGEVLLTGTDEEKQHGYSVSSYAKQVIEDWYRDKGLSNYSSYINENAIYCSDRSTTNGQGWRATGSAFSYDPAYRAGRTWNGSWSDFFDASPTLKCTNNLDKFTSKTSTIGNKALDLKGSGIIGAAFGVLFYKLFSLTGTYIVSSLFILLGLIFLTGINLVDVLLKPFKRKKKERKPSLEDTGVIVNDSTVIKDALKEVEADDTKIKIHSIDEITTTIDEIVAMNSQKPKFICANTIKGHGISFIANKDQCHMRNPKGDEWLQVCDELGIAYEEMGVL